MRKGRLLWVHGWGFGPEIWSAVRDTMAKPGEAFDLGYGGTPSPIPQGEWVGVGHSFGALWLLRKVSGLTGLVCVNGFARFPAPRRVVDRMRRRFEAAPCEVLDAFRARCGAQPWAGPRDDRRLGDDLEALAEWDERERLAALRVPLLSLAAGDDPLVPWQAAPALPHVPALVSRTGGHLLPLSQPAWVSEQIAAFVK